MAEGTKKNKKRREGEKKETRGKGEKNKHALDKAHYIIISICTNTR